MKSFLLKHKRTIIFWIIFLSIVLLFAPVQSEYYLDTDIKHFKRTYFTPVLFWTGVALILLLLLLLLINIKSIRKSLEPFLYGAVMIAFYLFIFRDVFLATALFINRQIKTGSVQRSYVANFMGDNENKTVFFPFDIAAGKHSMDNKLVDELYHPNLKQNDTLTLIFDKGLFGIAFPHKK